MIAFKHLFARRQCHPFLLVVEALDYAEVRITKQEREAFCKSLVSVRGGQAFIAKVPQFVESYCEACLFQQAIPLEIHFNPGD